MIDSSSETALKTTTINSHQSGKEKKLRLSLLFLHRKTVRSTHPHSNLTRMILGNVSVEDAVEVMYVLHLQVFMSRLIFYFDIS